MSCSGLHCAGCGGGAAVPVVAFAAFCGIGWVAEHLIEVVTVAAACAILAVAAVVWLMRWGERREIAHAARRSLWITREDPPALTATVIPRPVRAAAAPPALEQHVHYHLHVAGSYEPARAFTAIPGQAGEAITEGE